MEPEPGVTAAVEEENLQESGSSNIGRVLRWTAALITWLILTVVTSVTALLFTSWLIANPLDQESSFRWAPPPTEAYLALPLMLCCAVIVFVLVTAMVSVGPKKMGLKKLAASLLLAIWLLITPALSSLFGGGFWGAFATVCVTMIVCAVPLFLRFFQPGRRGVRAAAIVTAVVLFLQLGFYGIIIFNNNKDEQECLEGFRTEEGVKVPCEPRATPF